jgi:uracil-DNA glycosylase
LLEITRCCVIEGCLTDSDEHCGGCRRIVECQKAPRLSHFHLPEPWNGRLTTALILFVSSNPSLNQDELFPTWNWSDLDTIDFFEERFTSERGWVRNGRTLLRDGTFYSKKRVRFWSAMQNRASELLSTSGSPARPGIDFAITEAVRCKSTGEHGVAEALAACSGRYLERTLSLSGARVIVGVGETAICALRVLLSLPAPEQSPMIGRKPLYGIAGPIPVGGRGRHFAFLPHPSSAYRKTFATCLLPDELSTLQTAIRNVGENDSR